MNPFFLLFRRELELVHEFEADSESNAEELSSLILCTLYPVYYRDFTSQFFKSPIKRRIFMISKNKKSSMNMLRKMSIIPVAVIAMYLFAFKAAAAESNVEETVGVELIAQANTEVKITTTNEERILFHLVEVKPLFNGKNPDKEFREYVNSNIIYPEIAIKYGIQGPVLLEFTIDTDGSLIDVRVLRSADPLLDIELVRVVKASPKWTPGKHEGKAVKVAFQFPYLFKLPE